MFVTDRCLGTLEAALEELEADLARLSRAFEGGFAILAPGTPSSGGSCWQPEPDGWHETFIGLEPQNTSAGM